MDILIVLGQYLLPIIAPIVALLIIIAAKKLLDKWGIERSAKIDAMLDDYVKKGVNVAEVAGRKWLSTQGNKMAEGSKKAKAVKVVMTELEQAGITNIAEDMIADRIESWLEDDGKNPGVPSAPESTGGSV